MNDAPYNPEISDNAFATIQDGDMEWIESDIGLPPGVRVKRFHIDPVMKRRVSNVQFPPGYIEPEHTHQGWHCGLVVKGRMCVSGKDLRPGDSFFGWDIPHGPFEYPDGCEVFSVSLGVDMHHIWDEATFFAYKRQWEPETEEGRHGCIEFDRWRREKTGKIGRTPE